MNKVVGVDQHEQGGLTEVRRCPNRRQAEQYALVLTAMGMRSSIVPEGNFLTLHVAPEDAERADDELAAYDSENRERPHEGDWLRSAFPPIEVAMVYWVVLLFFFAAGRHEAFSFDWIGKGAVQSGFMLKGEWWRAVTALCLHANGTHLLGNLVFGTVFLLLLAQVTGAGVAGLSMVVAGAVGNVISALVQSPAYTSIGASTAIFASIGMLVALRQVRRRDQPISTPRKWTPLAGGFGLLIFLGLSGENTDILAHILGFGAGIVGGWLLAKWDHDWANDRRLQWKCAGTAGAAVVFAWAAALA
ncbi:MAG: rhomboid family intramembrane serine protease [Aestuariivirga sp.]